MAASAEVPGVVNTLRGAVRRFKVAVRPRATGRAVLALAEQALAQMGVPGAVGCCEYLVGWWGSSESCPHHLPRASATAAHDHERRR